MIVVYIFTALIMGAWTVQMVIERKFIFRRTLLDIPLLVFLGSQLISTVLSIDPSTSWFGYYSRFNGGLLSVICYSLLYWAFVSNLDRKSALRTLYSLLISAALVSVYGVLEHFGIDKNVWVQDVQSRVFSTLGQPNWLSAFLVALMPISWELALSNYQTPNSKPQTNSKFQIPNSKFLLFSALSILYFWTLIFTKSRSGLLGFGVAFLLFWGYVLWSKRKNILEVLRPFIVISSSLLIISLISGTQFTPSIGQLFNRSDSKFQIPTTTSGTALETGGTESGAIRKIVWKGALQIWLHYPIFGSGVETFAYSYYLYRPIEHNLTSEWDFIYNKAHNEFLNIAANSGTVGLVAYLVLIGFSIYLMIKNFQFSNSNLYTTFGCQSISNLRINNSMKIDNWQLIIIALAAGYVSILVTNFFGFSVVPTQLLFFLFPAIAIAIAESGIRNQESGVKKVTQSQKALVFCILLATCYLILVIGRYWNADRLYASGKGYNTIGKPDVATNFLVKAINLEPKQPIYYGDIASSYARLAVALNQQKDASQAAQFAEAATTQIKKAIVLSPANVNLKRTEFGIYVMLSAIDSNYLIDAKNTLENAILQAPTDAKIYYNLGLIYARTGQTDKALAALKKTVELKPNYKDARLAYSYILIDKKQNAEAKVQLEYILTNLTPNDSLTKQALESIK